VVESRKNRAMEKDNLVKTTWRIPAELHAELKEMSDRDKISINTIGVERLRAASVGDRFDKIDREITTLKQMMREMLDRIELLK
jgi:DNA-binding PadR family transcriptional regulator